MCGLFFAKKEAATATTSAAMQVVGSAHIIFETHIFVKTVQLFFAKKRDSPPLKSEEGACKISGEIFSVNKGHANRLVKS